MSSVTRQENLQVIGIQGEGVTKRRKMRVEIFDVSHGQSSRTSLKDMGSKTI